jgi:hypothetical protein
MLYLGALESAPLKKLLDAIATPHIDLAPMLGLDGPLRVDVDALDALIAHGEPALHLSYEDGSLVVQRQDGGVMATIEVKF